MFPSNFPLQHHGQSSTSYPLVSCFVTFLGDLLALRIRLLLCLLVTIIPKLKFLPLYSRNVQWAWDLSVDFCVCPSFWAITFVPILSHVSPSFGSLFPTSTNLSHQMVTNATKYVLRELSYHSFVSSTSCVFVMILLTSAYAPGSTDGPLGTYSRPPGTLSAHAPGHRPQAGCFTSRKYKKRRKNRSAYQKEWKLFF